MLHSSKIRNCSCSLYATLLLMFLAFLPSMNSQSLVTYGQPLLLTTSEYDQVNTKVADFKSINLSSLVLWSDVGQNASGVADFSINTGDNIVSFHLTRSSLIPEGAVYAVQNDGQMTTLVEMPDANFFRGYVNDDVNQPAGFIIEKDLVTGYFQFQGHMWTLENMASVSPGSTTSKNNFIIYKTPKSGEINCGTPSSGDLGGGNEDTPVVDDREPIPPHHVEVAYDVDGEIGGAWSEDKIINFLKNLTTKVEGVYKASFPFLNFHMVHVNIWKNKNTDPYNSTSITTTWDNLKTFWESPASGKACIQKDLVALISGRHFNSGIVGAVNDKGVDAVCGVRLTEPCARFSAYSVSAFSGEISDGDLAIHQTVAHEMAHNFGRNCHASDCTIMNSTNPAQWCVPNPNFTSCGTILINHFDGPTVTFLARRFMPRFQVWTNPGNGTGCTSPFFSNDCLLDAPPVDLGFKMTLKAEDVIEINAAKAILCPGDQFTATFYNTFDPNASIVWTLGPGLEFAANQPADNRKRNIVVSANAPCCDPNNSFVRVTFTYACGTVTYMRRLTLGSSFGLDGVYTSMANGQTFALQSTNPVVPGNYNIRMENPAGYYTWTIATGLNGTPVMQSTHSHTLLLNVPANQVRVVNVRVQGKCGMISRTYIFAGAWGGPQLVSSNTNIHHEAVLSPNPVSNRLNVNLLNMGCDVQDVNPQAEIRVLDNLGKLVKMQKIEDIYSAQQIDLSVIPPGHYNVQIVLDGVSKTYKIVKI